MNRDRPAMGSLLLALAALAAASGPSPERPGALSWKTFRCSSGRFSMSVPGTPKRTIARKARFFLVGHRLYVIDAAVPAGDSETLLRRRLPATPPRHPR